LGLAFVMPGQSQSCIRCGASTHRAYRHCGGEPAPYSKRRQHPSGISSLRRWARPEFDAAPAPIGHFVIAAQAAIQDEALPDSRTAPLTRAALHLTVGTCSRPGFSGLRPAPQWRSGLPSHPAFL